MLADFARTLGTVRLAPPRIPYLSNVTGTWIEERQATDPDYWVAHVRRAVRFDDGIRALAQAPDRVFLEVGPGRGLMTLARWHPARSAHQVALTSLPHSREGRPVASDGEWLTTTLGRLWLAGVDVDWGGVHAGEARRRVPLPTYPFQRRRFWIDAAPADAAGRASLENRPDVADWFYAPSWRRTAWPETRPGAASGPEPQSWLLLTDGDALHEDIARSVAGLGCRIVRVEPGDAYARGADEAFTVRPGNAEDYAALLAALDAERRPPARVVHLWNLNGGEARHLDAGFHALSALGRALGTRPSGTALHIDVVTSNMQEVVGGELLWPEKATVLGPCRAIPREYDGVTCRSIDVDTRDSGARPGFAAARRIVGDHIVRELFAWPAMRDTVVAHRGGYRWVQSFDPVRLDAPVEPAPGLRPHGVYLITGGLGGIGLEIAAFLARTVQARLALLGRSAPPPRSEWDDRLAAKPDDALSRRIEAVRAIEACGATVLTLGCDVSDEASLRDAVRRAEDELGGLNGVVHCAGVGGGALLQLQSAAGSAAVLAPKVAGTRALEAVLGDKRLDFVVLCSSRAAILGGFGQSDYCAANAFLDAFAHYRSAVGSTRTVAVDWAGWRDVGMRVDTLSKLGLLEPGAAAGEPIGHPLLHRRIEKTADREVFASVLDVASQWVLDDHRIARQPVVPGTAYLEMVRAAMRTRDPHAALEFSDVYFLNVLPVREDEPQEVRVVLEGAGPELDFRIRSRTVVGGRETWQDHVMGRARTLPPQDAPRRDVDALIRRCNVEHRVIAADDPIVTYEDLGPRWLSMKKVWLGRDELVALLELPPQFADDVAVYELHPALLDRANFTAKVFLAFDGLHLPMGYRAIRIRRPLTPKIYVYAKYKPSGDPLLETITFDVALMDEHGVELVGVDEFSQKRVRDAGEAIKSAAMRSRGPAAPRRVEAAVASRADEPVAGTLSPAEGVDAFRRILATTTAAQIVVSPNDLAAAIEHADRLRQEAIDDAAEDSASPAEEKHARPDLPTEYVAPRGPVEAALAEIWERTLGIEPIGIDDNFFDLGGDSVVGIQLVAQAKKKDLKLSPQQLFGNQTIRELAAALDGAQQGGGAPSAARGHVPLSPPQLQRLERRSDGAERRTRSALLDLRRRVEPALLARAAAQLPLHHDALRLRVERTDNGWLQRCAADTGPSPFAHADLSALPAGAQGEALSRLRRQALDAVDPAAGPLLRVLFVEQRSDFGRLLIVTDDLFVDDASWSILLSDLETVCDQLTRGEPVRLPDAAVSFSEWADSAAEYASSDQLERDLGWWRENLAGAPRPEPAADGDGTRGPKRDAVSSHPDSARVTLGAADTAALLNDGPRRFRMAAGDIIVAALAATLAGAGAGTESRAGADGDRRGGAADDVATGRDGLGADAGKTDAGKTDAGMTDTRGVTIEIRERRHEPAHHEQPARTVGPLSPSFPIVLRANPLEDAGASLTSIKEQLRAVPRGGLGWGAARHARGREDAAVVDAPRVDATCRYVGPIGEPLASSQTFTLIDFDAVAGSGAHGAAAAALDVLAVIRDGELRVEWRRLRTGRGAEPVDCAARRFLERLQTLARHCAGAEAGVYTPSDFPMAKVSQAQLDRIASQLVGQRQS
ncbi:MAG: SDR family NAD(P)-dependent oxidoreductase [Gammaproteobacteria bacterium]|nr:SDR family NAD(P)-dependent oxidoreductase [Gammaproteobacteria bacterium]